MEIGADDGRVVLEVAGLCMRYGEQTALDDVGLRVERGEVVCLLGPNGAGKSTTVEILEGFRTRSAGRVRVLSADPVSAGEHWRARVGARPANLARPRPLASARTARTPRRVLPALLHVGHAPALGCRRTARRGRTRAAGTAKDKDPVGPGSGAGSTWRSGLVGRPELLFLDEPTAGLDPVARREFHVLLAGLAAERAATILLTTHDLAEAERLAHRIVVLDQGRIIADGTPGELTERYGGEPAWVLRHPSLEDAYLALMDGAEDGAEEGRNA